MILKVKTINRSLLIFLFTFTIKGQSVFNIVEYKSFPSELKILDIYPDKIEWGVANGFLLLDKINNQMVSLNSFNEVKLFGGFAKKQLSLSGPIWMGIAPKGITLIDRLDNKVIFIDYRLSYMNEVSIEPRIYPDIAVIDNWGNIYMYSNQYNSIFVFKDKSLDKRPHIDLNRYKNIEYCIKSMSINQDGDLALLSCENSIHLFTRYGEYKKSYFPNLITIDFLVSIRERWFVFNKDGFGKSLILNEDYNLPNVSTPIIDIKSMNRSLAVLSKDHILILNAKIK